MRNLKKLAIALNQLGLKKEAALVLSLKKIAFDPVAYNQISLNVKSCISILQRILNIVTEYLEYKKADPDDTMLSDNELRDMYENIKKLLSGATREDGEEVPGPLRLIEESWPLAGTIGFLEGNLMDDVMQHLDIIYKETEKVFNLFSGSYYKNDRPRMQKAKLLASKIKIENIIKKCKQFLEIYENTNTKDLPRKTGPYLNFDPSRENTVVGLERTQFGDIDSPDNEIEVIDTENIDSEDSYQR